MSAAVMNVMRNSDIAVDFDAIPELDSVIYATEVLRLGFDRTEQQHDDELDAKANALGVAVPRQLTSDKRYTSSAQSASTACTNHTRTFSAGSNTTTSTAATDFSSLFAPPSPELKATDATPSQRSRPKSLNFTHYERYIARIGPNLDQPKNKKAPSPLDASSKSLFSVKTGRTLSNIKSGFRSKMRLRRRSIQPFDLNTSCICCRETFEKPTALHALPCSHSYCSACLKVMVQQATTDESKMPPRCCTEPVPSQVLRTLLTKDNQQSFLKAVRLFSTPWESRIFCPNAGCGEFIPPRAKVDPKHPSTVTCRQCQTRVCTMCKREAHGVGKDCPEDWELERVLKIGEKSGWRRCYKCRNLVELAQGCTHVTCRCKAQFCYICGGVWDSTLGCPNVCGGEEELERRRVREEEMQAEIEAEKCAKEAAEALRAAERLRAQERSRSHIALQKLETDQLRERVRFDEFTGLALRRASQRQSAQKASLLERHTDQEEKMKERHAKTANHLEDRQIAAEMELRSTLEASERSVKIRLKHMEAYCDGLSRSDGSSKMPTRTVTDRDLRELGHQYTLRDGMERLHQSKINVMRDRQAKRMEELLERHDTEMMKLQDKKREEVEDLAARFAHEHDVINGAFKERRLKLGRRWEIAMEVLCKELGNQDGVEYAPLPRPIWPDEAIGASEPSTS